MDSFVGKYFPYVFTHFRLSYLGVFAPMVWVYCILHRSGIDYGTALFPAIFYLATAVGMLLFVGFWRLAGDEATRIALKWPVAAIAALITCFATYPFPFSNQMGIITAVIGGICSAGMYMSWAPFYAKLDLRNAVASIFGAMAVSCAIKALVDLVAPLPATILLTIMPLASARMLAVTRTHWTQVAEPPEIYFHSARTSFPYTILIGIAVYSFIIGVVPAVAPAPAYTPFELMTLVHHGVEILVAAAALFWVFCYHGTLHFTNLWRTILLITATGLFFLPVISVEWVGWALVLIAIAQTLMVALLLAMLADAAHHSAVSPYVIFGFAWVAYALAIAIGQFVGPVIAANQDSNYIVAILTYALTLTAIFALNERSFIQSRIFTDLDIPMATQSMYGSIEEGCKELGRRYGLTDREVEIVELLCKGRSKSYIAETLVISENTVRTHSRHIYNKLEVHSKQEIMDMVSDLEKAVR